MLDQVAADALVTLRARGSSASELARCCALLGDLHNVSEAAAAAVAVAMQKHPAHAALQCAACKALSSLPADGAAQRASAAAAGGVEAVAAALLAFPADARLQRSACFALCAITGDNEQHRARMCAAGAVPAVVAALKAHGSADDEMQHAACAALTRLLSDASPGSVAAAVQAGAADAVIAVLRGGGAGAGAPSPRCCAAACFALAGLAASAATRLQITNAGGIEDIVGVLSAHAADPLLSGNACSVLARVYGAGDGAPCARACSAAAAAAAAVVAAMDAHRGSAHTQRQGCYALWTMAHGGSNRAAHVRAAGGIAAAVAALRAHPADAAVQTHGCDAVAHLCLGNARAALEAGAAGAVEAVTRAMRTLAAHDYRRSDCFAMRVLVAPARDTGGANAAKAAAAGATAALVRMLQQTAHGETEEWHGDACWALCFIARHDARQADAPGGIEAVVATLRRATDERARDAAAAAASFAAAAAAVAARAEGVVALPLEAGMLAALRTLIDGSATRQDRALRAGALQAVSAAAESDVSGNETARAMLQSLQPALHAAAGRHDAGSCAHPTCARCAGQRASGSMCALPGCGARVRAAAAPSGRHKSLLRCARCRCAAYCGTVHSHADWARHKAGCRRAHANESP